jgi:hypothetical protein
MYKNKRQFLPGIKQLLCQRRMSTIWPICTKTNDHLHLKSKSPKNKDLTGILSVVIILRFATLRRVAIADKRSLNYSELARIWNFIDMCHGFLIWGEDGRLFLCIKQSIINNNRIKSNGIKVCLGLSYNWTWFIIKLL